MFHRGGANGVCVWDNDRLHNQKHLIASAFQQLGVFFVFCLQLAYLLLTLALKKSHFDVRCKCLLRTALIIAHPENQRLSLHFAAPCLTCLFCIFAGMLHLAVVCVIGVLHLWHLENRNSISKNSLFVSFSFFSRWPSKGLMGMPQCNVPSPLQAGRCLSPLQSKLNLASYPKGARKIYWKYYSLPNWILKDVSINCSFILWLWFHLLVPPSFSAF